MSGPGEGVGSCPTSEGAHRLRVRQSDGDGPLGPEPTTIARGVAIETMLGLGVVLDKRVASRGPR